MQITLDQLSRATGCGTLRATTWLPHLNASMQRWGIDTPTRAAHFLAQISVESARLATLEENLSYSAERLIAVWPTRFKTLASAAPFARNPEALANHVYSGRMGNTQPGDGWKYRGRGLKQLTGKDNYLAYMMAAGVDCLVRPELLLLPEHAADSAGWFWSSNGCSALADKCDNLALTKRINGGTTGLAERIAGTSKALAALGA